MNLKTFKGQNTYTSIARKAGSILGVNFEVKNSNNVSILTTRFSTLNVNLESGVSDFNTFTPRGKASYRIENHVFKGVQLNKIETRVCTPALHIYALKKFVVDMNLDGSMTGWIEDLLTKEGFQLVVEDLREVIVDLLFGEIQDVSAVTNLFELPTLVAVKQKTKPIEEMFYNPDTGYIEGEYPAEEGED